MAWKSLPDATEGGVLAGGKRNPAADTVGFEEYCAQADLERLSAE